MEFQFIACETPDEPNKPVKQRTIRAQAARHHWARDAALRASRPKRYRRIQNLQLSLRMQEWISPESWNLRMTHDIQCQLDRNLGAGRVDPFHTYPVAWQQYFPEVIDHCEFTLHPTKTRLNSLQVIDVMDMAVPIPEIDGPDRYNLLRTQWFPLAMTDPATFLSILLLSASHLCSVQKKSGVAVTLLHLKQQVIEAIRDGLIDPTRFCSDALIGAVAKLCSYEAMYGNIEAYTTHMTGLQQMVNARGGLSKLGLNGMLCRICLWVDLNSAFLIGSPRFFAGSYFDCNYLQLEANPGQFIGYNA